MEKDMRSSTNDFEIFWRAYPRKVGKADARRVFDRAIKKTTLERMLETLSWQRTQDQWLRDGGAYIPHPSTWLHGERWEDEPSETPTLKKQTLNNLRAIDQWLKEG
jgi:hypothetical protein